MRVLVTGGAGFIGSHIADSYLADNDDVIVLDNLATGSKANVSSKVEFVLGDITDLDVVRRAMNGVEVVFHEAAARAVLRSVEDPVGTDRTNTLGTLNVLLGARDAGVRRVVIASSSSVYGGSAPLPTSELSPLRPRSPYAVSKLAGESYSVVFAELYGLETVSLRYFNVFGPRQRPDSQYAAVVPQFLAALCSDSRPEIHGDGLQSRDFTYIDDVVRANRLAAVSDASTVSGRVYNIAGGENHTIVDLLDQLSRILDVDARPIHVAVRAGDVRSSQADITAARRDFGFAPSVSFEDGLRKTAEWFRSASHAYES
jgi:UDP-glucose 4-epimerase